MQNLTECYALYFHLGPNRKVHCVPKWRSVDSMMEVLYTLSFDCDICSIGRFVLKGFSFDGQVRHLRSRYVFQCSMIWTVKSNEMLKKWDFFVI